MSRDSLTFGSLFAGIGGMDLGLERAGMECKWQVEIDDYATRVLAKHWPNVQRWSDITTFPPDSDGERSDETDQVERPGGTIPRRNRENAETLRERQECEPRSVEVSDVWRVDCICGGFPCQDISFAGMGAGLAGARSGLFYEAIRVVGLIRPRFVLLENVAALLSRGLDDVLGTLAAIGYDTEWHCIPAAAVGAPHIRDRVFIIGTKSRNTYCIDDPDHAIFAGNESDDEPRTGRQSQEEFRGICSHKPTTSYWWATESDVGRVVDGVPSRVDRLRGLGNAVVPQVAEFIGRQIVSAATNPT